MHHMDRLLVDLVKDKQSNSKPDDVSIITKLEMIASKWIRQKCIAVSFDKERVPCLVLLHGSVALGMGSTSGDIDAVLLVPNYIDREDYFTSFLDTLKTCDEITNCVAITDTLVPLIRMFVNGTQVDLSLSVFGAARIPRQLNIKMDPGELFYNMDPASVHSLSGVVLAHEIRQVLDKDPLYYTLLQTVRSWVRARSLNSFIYGFPPSVAWTIMVAYICKRISDGFDPLTCVCETGTHSGSGTNRQQHSITCMLRRFFCVFSSWDWPRPVLLTPVRDILNLSVRTWKWQENRSKDVALMPVISPAFPNKNTTFSVREATKNIAVRELQRGRDILRNSLHSGMPVNTLFEKFDIRISYRHFLLITFFARSTEELAVLGGLVNSRLRDLAQLLDDMDHVQETRIHRVPIGSERTEQRVSQFVSQWLIGMDIEPGPRKPDGSRTRVQIDVTPCLSQFLTILHERDPDTDFRTRLSHEYLKQSQVRMFNV